MTTIRNPILPGFHPDPSILRVGSDYYLATSTFEWFPGVPLYHSKDLAHWRLIGHALTRTSQLDLRGVVDSGGIWAPSLSFHDNQFWLIYTIVRTRVGNYKDVHNYLVTAPSLHGPWSEPVYLNASGFDPSLFHDEDGRKWLTQIQWDFRKGRPAFSGIVVQEYDATRQALVGEPVTVLRKTRLIEGPNLYRRNGHYYLMLAEGGTGWNHAVSMARARHVLGPYELDPQDYVVTSKDRPGLMLQKAGHGEIVETPEGEWYLAHLASRPVLQGEARRCMLGRETCLQKVEWSDDGWLRLRGGGTDPKDEVEPPRGVAPHPWPVRAPRDEFDAPELDLAWQSLRIPVDDTWLSLKARPGWLRLIGRESPRSTYEQSLVARRLTSVRSTFTTRVEFAPKHFTQMAGLICWYDTKTHYYLRVTHEETLGRVVGVALCDDQVYDEPADAQLPVGDWPEIHLRAEIDGARLQFFASPDGGAWHAVGPVLDASKLSDDYGQGLHFTGAFVGLCAQDLRGTRTPADFDYFEVLTRP